jgi:hypothetical protein
MRENRIGLGHVLSGVGALIALISLWLPWLKLDLDKVKQEPAFQAATQAGGVPTQIQADINLFVDRLPKSISGNGWDVLQRTDIAFGLGAAAILALIFATVSLGADSRGTARIATFVGMIGMFLVLLKLASPGIPDDAADFVTRGSGPMVALIGWTICAAGGILVIWNPPPAQAPVAVEPFVVEPVAPVAAPEPVLQAVPEPVAQAAPEPAPLTPEYTPDPAKAATSVGPPPRS